MFGVSGAEFLVIVLVAILVVPVKYWPDVARFFARAVKYIRGVLWKITDASEQITTQIDLEKPIDEIIHTTTRDMLDDFSVKLPKRAGRKKIKK
ncbi:MAG: hypothetical protein J6W41_01475 [Alphaproteobacteria bacterium]|nr:hypothetical protein [Alphaproteobacteria bacterium]